MEYYHLAELEATNKMIVVVSIVNVVRVDDAILMMVRFHHCRIVVWYVDNADDLIDKDVRRPKYFLDSAVAVQFPFSFLTFFHLKRLRVWYVGISMKCRGVKNLRGVRSSVELMYAIFTS